MGMGIVVAASRRDNVGGRGGEPDPATEDSEPRAFDSIDHRVDRVVVIIVSTSVRPPLDDTELNHDEQRPSRRQLNHNNNDPEILLRNASDSLPQRASLSSPNCRTTDHLHGHILPKDDLKAIPIAGSSAIEIYGRPTTTGSIDCDISTGTHSQNILSLTSSATLSSLSKAPYKIIVYESKPLASPTPILSCREVRLSM
nr:hypothetical protein CFP56_77269 [Quercus suber]